MKKKMIDIRNEKIIAFALVAVLLLIGTVGLASAAGRSVTYGGSGGLVAYYPFNDNDANDASGNGNDGTVYDATWVDNGGCGKALSFDGLDDYVETTLESSGKTKTLTAWIHPKSSDAVSYIESVIDSDVPGQYGTGWGLDNGYIKVIADDLFWSTSQPVILDQWQHVAVTYSPTELKLYYNGKLVDNKIYTQGSITIANYKIGKSNANSLYFHGFIDEVHIYNYALSQFQIQEDMRECTPSTPTATVGPATPTPVPTLHIRPTIPPTAEAVITVKSPKEGARYPAGEYVLVDWSAETPTDIKTVASYVNGQRRGFGDQWRKGDRVAFAQYQTGYPMNTEAKLGRNVFRVDIELVDGRKYEKEVVFYIGEAEATPTPTITKLKKCEGDKPYMYVGDRVMGKGKTIEIPIIMCNAKDLANMDLDWSYDASVLKLIDVTKGSLNKNAFFEWNEVSPGKLKIAFAFKKDEEISGSGSIAVMKFEVIGNTGAKSTITGTVDTAGKTDGSTVSVGVNPGEVTVGTSPIKGDCDGDNKLTSKDALTALRISVQKIPFDICYDYNGDGKVNSADARDILKAIVTGGK